MHTFYSGNNRQQQSHLAEQHLRHSVDYMQCLTSTVDSMQGLLTHLYASPSIRLTAGASGMDSTSPPASLPFALSPAAAVCCAALTCRARQFCAEDMKGWASGPRPVSSMVSAWSKASLTAPVFRAALLPGLVLSAASIPYTTNVAVRKNNKQG